MPIKTNYEKMVEEHGKDYADARMREMRSKVKSPGLANSDAAKRQEISRLGVEARRRKRADKI